MDNKGTSPSVNWAQFEVINKDLSKEFQRMCLDLFAKELAQEGIGIILHENSNNRGVEVDPVPSNFTVDGKRIRISFQSKYSTRNVSYSKIKESAKQAVNTYAGELDRIYLFCNITISERTKSLAPIVSILQQENIELKLVTNEDILALVRKHIDIEQRYFLGQIIIYNTDEIIGRIKKKNDYKRKQYLEDKEIFKELIAPVEILNVSSWSANEYINNSDLTSVVKAVTKGWQTVKPIILTAKAGQGKSTQLAILWQKYEEQMDDQGKHNYVGLFCQLRGMIGKKNLLFEILDKYGLSKEEKDTIIKDMDRPSDTTGHHYILLLDGLDEAKSENVNKLIEAFIDDYREVQVIITGRRNSLHLSRETINMNIQDLSHEKVEEWLKTIGEERKMEKYNEYLSGNPMLLTLAYKTDKDFAYQNDDTRYIKRRQNYPLRYGEVLWNYIEYTIVKYYCNNVGETDKSNKEKHIRYIMQEVLPYIAYWIFFKGNNPEGISEGDLYALMTAHGEKKPEAVKKTIDSTLKGIFQKTSNGYLFEHQLFTDFFAMLYVSNAFYKAYSDKNLLTEKELQVLSNEELFDNLEYSELLLCVVPFTFGFVKNDYEQDFIRWLNSKLNYIKSDGEIYNNPNNQVLRLLRAKYSLYLMRYYYTNKELINYINKTEMDHNTVNYLLDVANIVDDSTNNLYLTMESYSAVLNDLSPIYRIGSLFVSMRKISKIENFKTDLNKSFDLSLKALKLCQARNEVVDEYNYLAKVFLEARNMIKAHHISKPNEEYVLGNNDLLIDCYDEKVLDCCLNEHVSLLHIGKLQEGDKLSPKDQEARIECLESIAKKLSEKGKEKESGLSINLLALSEEMEQEEKVFSDRDYVPVLSDFMRAANLKKRVSSYSAKEAALLLVQKKAGINSESLACAVENADEGKTISQISVLLDIAALNRSYWDEVRFYRGQLKKNFHNDGKKNLKNNEALESAFEDFVCTFNHLQDEKFERRISVILEVIDTGLKLYSILQEDKKSIAEHVGLAMKKYMTLLPKSIEDAKGIRPKDKWTPSYVLIKEYMCTIKECAEKYRKEIKALSLSDQMNECLTLIQEKEADLSKAKQ